MFRCCIPFLMLWALVLPANTQDGNPLQELQNIWGAHQVKLDELLVPFEEKLVVFSFDKPTPDARVRTIELRLGLLKKEGAKNEAVLRRLRMIETEWHEKMKPVTVKLEEFEKIFQLQPLPAATVGERMAMVRASVGLPAALEAIKEEASLPKESNNAKKP